MPQTITIDVTDESEIPQAIQKIVDEVHADFDRADYTVPLKLVSKEIERFEERLFASERAPDGTPWAPLAPSTIRRKGHDVILHETGRLGASLFSETGDSIRDVDPRYLSFGTAVPYSIFHTTGTSRMPAREHVGLDDEMVDLISEYVLDGAVVAIGGVPEHAP